MSAAPVMSKLMKVSISVTKGPLTGEDYHFEKDKIRVGRGAENDVILAQDVKVSRHHLELRLEGVCVVVENLNPKNPLAIDGELAVQSELRPGAILRFGDTELVVNFEKTEATKKRGLPSGSAVVVRDRQDFASVKSTTIAPQAYEPSTISQEPSSRQPQRAPNAGGSSKLVFYGVLVMALIFAAYLSQEVQKRRARIKLRDASAVEAAISESETAQQKIESEANTRGENTVQYQLAQEQYLRGFRDFRVGQYGRAMESFRAALSFYPSHLLASKYLTLSRKKFDEFVSWNMIQGKRYYGIQNYRLCKSYYSKVVVMVKDETNRDRKEALQYYNECDSRMRGKF